MNLNYGDKIIGAEIGDEMNQNLEKIIEARYKGQN